MVRQLMKSQRVLATHHAPPRPATLEGGDPTFEADALRTVHHVLHGASGLKVWRRAGEVDYLALGLSAVEEAQLVRVRGACALFARGLR